MTLNIKVISTALSQSVVRDLLIKTGVTLTLGGIGGGLGGGSTSIDGEAFSAAFTRIKTIKSDKIMFSCV